MHCGAYFEKQLHLMCIFSFKVGLLRLYLYRFKSEPLDKDNPWSNNQKTYERRKKDFGS